MKKVFVCGLVFVGVLAVWSAVPESAAHKVTVSGSGSGAFEDPVVGGGGVAYATCTLDRTLQTFECQTRVYNIVDLTAAHIHVGGPGKAGPVVIPIPNLPLRISGAFGQSFTLTPSTFVARPAQGIRTFEEFLFACASGNCYFNWHTTGNPGGEIRVQLCPMNRASNTYAGVAVCTSEG